MRSYLNFLEVITGKSDFSIGSKERILKLSNDINFIPIICYEIIFFWKLINSINMDADILINITNDGWFGNKIGPYQHFNLSKMKASEFNKILIRVSNNGISAIINNNGKVLKMTNLNFAEKIKYNLEIYNNVNMISFHKYFNFLIIIFFIFLFVSRLFIKDEY